MIQTLLSLGHFKRESEFLNNSSVTPFILAGMEGGSSSHTKHNHCRNAGVSVWGRVRTSAHSEHISRPPFLNIAVGQVHIPYEFLCDLPWSVNCRAPAAKLILSRKRDCSYNLLSLNMPVQSEPQIDPR